MKRFLLLLAAFFASCFGIGIRPAVKNYDVGERGLSIDHRTIYRWVQAYAPELEKRIRPHLRLTNAWRLREQGAFFALERDKFLFKNFPFFREKNKLQFRWEIYNLINHTLVRRWTMPHGFTAPTRKSAHTSAE